MGRINDTVQVYERLSKNKYKITIENGVEIILNFDSKFYHHLVGFHYLTDISSISNPPHGKKRFYRQLKNGAIKEADIYKSELFYNINERVDCFPYIEEIMASSECKIIVEFDRKRADSDIIACYFLYKREGDPLNKEPVTYYSLFIGYDADTGEYYPATYVVEHSRKYVKLQNMLDCKIEVIPKHI